MIDFKAVFARAPKKGRFAVLLHFFAGLFFFVIAAQGANASSDLIPENISVPTNVAPGASFTVSWTLANTGISAANATSTTVVRINQSTSSAAGTNLASVNTAAVNGGTSVSQSVTLTAPTTPGTYYVWVIADNFSQVTNQSNTSNDLQHSAAIVIPPTTSDLIPQNINVPASVASGASFSANWTLANIGSGAANSTSTTAVRINQSTSSAAGTNLASISTAALSGGTSVSQNATLPAPSAPGTYYVWVLADDFSKVTNQSNTSNDLQHSAAFTVTPEKSDLIPQNIQVPANVAPGASFTVNWTLANTGAAAANSSSNTVVRINQSASSAAGTNLANISTAALAAGASVSQSATLTAPSSTGNYYVWILADDNSQVTNQSNTANDLQHSSAFTVQQGDTPSWTWPIASSSDRSVVSQDYEDYNDSYFGGNHLTYHTGFDIAEPAGTSVVAARTGNVVKFVRNVPGCKPCQDHGDGNTLVIKHSGKIFSQYQHLQGLVSTLDSQIASACQSTDQVVYTCTGNTVHVRAGDQIAYVGGSGFGNPQYYAYHLHFEIKDFANLSSPTLSKPQYGYTGSFPDSIGYIDPSNYLDGTTSIPLTQVTVTAAGNGVALRLGPRQDYPAALTTSAGAQYYARQTAPATTNCSMGWYQVIKGQDYPPATANFFSSTGLSTVAHLPDAWICRGNNGTAFVSP